jgi:hypothetical protein
LHLRVIQASYTWDSPYADAIEIVEYTIVNIGTKKIDSAYVGFFYEADVGPISTPNYWTHNFSGYYSDSRTGYVHNPVDLGSTPSGVTLLAAFHNRDSIPLNSLSYAFNWFPGPNTPVPDLAKYAMMSSNFVKPDEFPSLSDSRFVFSFGPFTINPGSPPLPGVTPDTIKIAVAILSGYDPRGNHLLILKRNASRALNIYKKQSLQIPSTPPSPPLHADVGFRRVTLNWKWTPADSAITGRGSPETNWDTTSIVARRYADRIDPPFIPGFDSLSGGRNFEAYKIWRSEFDTDIDPLTGQYQEPPLTSFTLLKQIDVPTDSFEYNTGYGPGPNGEYHFDGLLPNTYTDSNLVRGKVYWYSVTSKSIPDIVIQEGVEVAIDPLESSITGRNSNLTRIELPFAVSTQLGKVSVVPNPYRTDHNYTQEFGGYEGSIGLWNETKRVIKFINLPAKCTIRVFSLSGDLVRTIHHDGSLNADGSTASFPRGDHEMELVSESNRALASGIYIFAVESDLGTQTGKFVIIR